MCKGHRLWLRVCPGYFRVWVLIGFLSFLDPGRNKTTKDKQAKVLKSVPQHTNMTIHASNRSQSTFTRDAFQVSFSHIPVSIVDEWETYRWRYQRYSGGEQILACVHSLSTRAVWRRFLMAGWRGTYLPIKCF